VVVESFTSMSRQSRRALLGALLAGVALSGLSIMAWEHLPCRELSRIHRGFACDPDLEGPPPTYGSLEETLRARLQTARASHDVTRAALHFRDLHTGEGFGIDDDQRFAPASLLKLALAFVFFAQEDEDPGQLEKALLYAPEQVHDFTIPKQVERSNAGLRVGSSYAVSVLLRATLAQSDNLAYYVLLQHLTDEPGGRGRERFRRTLREIGIVDPPSFAEEVASPRDYVALFRQLYNASYLDPKASDTLLSW
jgi:beta-lactamase class A